MSNEKTVSKFLKLKRPHPNKAFKIGFHIIGPIAKEFKLSPSEVKELASKGCQHWIEEVSESKEVKPKAQPKPEQKD